MNGRIVFRVILTILLVAAIAGVGFYVYNIGLMQGRAQGAQLVDPEGGTAPYLPYGYWPYFRPFGFGFGFFGIFFLLFFFFFVARVLFWRPYGGWGRHFDDHGRGVSSRFEEWHRKQHEDQLEQQ